MRYWLSRLSLFMAIIFGLIAIAPLLNTLRFVQVHRLEPAHWWSNELRYHLQDADWPWTAFREIDRARERARADQNAVRAREKAQRDLEAEKAKAKEAQNAHAKEQADKAIQTLMTRVAELEKQREEKKFDEEWINAALANFSSLMQLFMAILATYFAWLGYRIQRGPSKQSQEIHNTNPAG
jgi:hypothetical protein